MDDNKFIDCMAYMKEYCTQIISCDLCPMFDNCTTGHGHEPLCNVPGLWFIPDKI